MGRFTDFDPVRRDAVAPGKATGWSRVEGKVDRLRFDQTRVFSRNFDRDRIESAGILKHKKTQGSLLSGAPLIAVAGREARQSRFRSMSDDKLKRGGADRDRINVHEEYELRYWSEKFGVSAEKLKETVQRVGVMVSDAERELKK
jgi:hypothetical protein